MLEKIEYIILLKDFYGPLLTEKQQYVLNLYYENDWSLSEIAEEMRISRQAIYDLLKRAENALNDYEERLQLVKKFRETRKQIGVVYELLNSEAQVDRETLTKAVNMLREVTENL